MRTLTIRFIASRTVVGLLIRFSTISLFEHAEMLSRDGTGWIGAHAVTGVEKRPLDWAKHLILDYRYTIMVQDKAFDRAHDYLESMIGTPYDYGLILGLLLHSRKIALWSKKRVDCSELVTEVLQAAGKNPLNVQQGYDALVTPETLHLSSIFIGNRQPQLLNTPSPRKENIA